MCPPRPRAAAAARQCQVHTLAHRTRNFAHARERRAFLTPIEYARAQPHTCIRIRATPMHTNPTRAPRVWRMCRSFFGYSWAPCGAFALFLLFVDKANRHRTANVSECAHLGIYQQSTACSAIYLYFRALVPSSLCCWVVLVVVLCWCDGCCGGFAIMHMICTPGREKNKAHLRFVSLIAFRVTQLKTHLFWIVAVFVN